MYKKCKHLKLRTKKGERYFYCSRSRKKVDSGCFSTCSDKEYSLPSKLPKTSRKQLKRTPIKVKPKKYQTSEKTYKEVFERCSGKCALCLTEQHLELHHIKGRGRFLTDDPDNCIMLCGEFANDCHKGKAHKKKKFWKPILLKIVERQKNNKLWYEEDN